MAAAMAGGAKLDILRHAGYKTPFSLPQRAAGIVETAPALGMAGQLGIS